MAAVVSAVCCGVEEEKGLIFKVCQVTRAVGMLWEYACALPFGLLSDSP